MSKEMSFSSFFRDARSSLCCVCFVSLLLLAAGVRVKKNAKQERTSSICSLFSHRFTKKSKQSQTSLFFLFSFSPVCCFVQTREKAYFHGNARVIPCLFFV